MLISLTWIDVKIRNPIQFRLKIKSLKIGSANGVQPPPDSRAKVSRRICTGSSASGHASERNVVVHVAVATAAGCHRPPRRGAGRTAGAEIAGIVGAEA